MSKAILILSFAIFIAIIAGGGFFAYQQGYIFKKEVVLTPEKLLTFEIKNQNLSPEAAEIYQRNFNELKPKLEQNKDDFASWLFLGILKKGVGDYEGSRDVWTYVAQIRPQSSTPFANLADLYANFLNEPQKGLEMIKTAIANDPNDYNLYLILAEIYRYRLPGQEAGYETTMLEALQKFPDNPNLIGPLALYYRQIGQIDKAIEYYEKLVRVAPNNETAKQDLEELRNK